MAELTKSKVDGLKPAANAYVVWDRGRLPGFGLKVLPSGRKVFILDTRIDGRSRRLTLGRYGAITLDRARRLASDRLGEVTEGRDPTAEKRAARAMLTVSELADIYLDAAAAGLVATRFGRPKKASTVAIDRGMVVRHIKPLIGSIRVDKLRQADVQRMIDGIASGSTSVIERTKPRGRARVTGGRGIASRTTELLGGIWSWGLKRGHVSGPSPTSGTDRFRSQPADRRLSAEELSQLGRAIEDSEREWREFEAVRRSAHEQGRRAPRAPKGLISPQATTACRLAALTGMRPGEVIRLRWSEADVATQTIILGDSKTGRSRRPMGKAAVETLTLMPRTSKDWLFPASRGDGSAVLKKAMTSIFERAGVRASPKVLRSTFASVAADLGYADGTISDMLGHARRGVTERHYIRRVDAVLISAADACAAEVSRLMNSA